MAYVDHLAGTSNGTPGDGVSEDGDDRVIDDAHRRRHGQPSSMPMLLSLEERASERRLQSAGRRFVAPHLHRAVSTRGPLNDAMNAADIFSALLDAGHVAVVLVDDALTIVHANAGAMRMLVAGDPIRENRGQIELAAELVPGQLTRTIRAAGKGTTHGGRGIAIPAHRRDGSPAMIRVMSMRRPGIRSWSPNGTPIAVLISERGPPELPNGALSVLYDLTPAEVRVFELVAAGMSNADIARTLGVLPSTVKTHLHRVFEKTGQQNRVGLANLAHSVRLPG